MPGRCDRAPFDPLFPMAFPRSAQDREGGLVYFPRMLHKIRLHEAGELPDDYHPFLGIGMDGRLCNYLRVNYADVVERVREGLDDAAVLTWCLGNGRQPNDVDQLVFNDFTRKRGWNDEDPSVAEVLAGHKAEAGLADRDDIRTFFEFFEVAEGRRD